MFGPSLWIVQPLFFKLPPSPPLFWCNIRPANVQRMWNQSEEPVESCWSGSLHRLHEDEKKAICYENSPLVFKDSNSVQHSHAYSMSLTPLSVMSHFLFFHHLKRFLNMNLGIYFVLGLTPFLPNGQCWESSLFNELVQFTVQNFKNKLLKLQFIVHNSTFWTKVHGSKTWTIYYFFGQNYCHIT